MKAQRIKTKAHKFPYIWYLKDLENAVLDKGTMFSTFSCGGGSTMGAKLAGFKVLGCNEIDPKMMKAYVTNHHPKYSYLEPIQTFKQRKDLPKELYNLDIFEGSPPCFESGTLVYTSKGFKEIENVTIGDFVLTHTNTFQKVTNVMCKKVSTYYKMKVQGVLPFKVTGDHPFYTREMKRTGDIWHREFSQPKWKDVKDLQVIRNTSNTIVKQDYIGIAVNTNSSLPEWDGVTWLHPTKNGMITRSINTIDFTKKSFWFLVGYFIGNGWVRYVDNSENGKKSRYSVILSCGKHNKDKLIASLNQTQFKYIISNGKTALKFEISSKELAEYLLRFNKGASNKELTNDVLDLPIRLLKAFLNGYLSADGHYDVNHSKWSCSSVSKKLIVGIQQCVAKAYHQQVSISTKDNSKYGSTIEGRLVITKLVYSLHFFKEAKKQQSGFYENGYIWVPFRDKKLKQKNKKINVYNLSVENDESYTVYNLICHNCSSFSMGGDRAKTWGTEKVFKEGQSKQVLDTLFFDWIDLAKELQSKMVIAENVKGLLMGNAVKYLAEVYKQLDKAGYIVNHYLLDASKMGVPQKRERVFIVGLRKDLAKPFTIRDGLFGSKLKLDLTFNEPIIPLKDFAKSKPKTNEMNYLPDRYGDNVINVNKPSRTLTTGIRLWFDENNVIDDESITKIATFPMDYDYAGNPKLYLTAMSVPPVAYANLLDKIYHQILKHIK